VNENGIDHSIISVQGSHAGYACGFGRRLAGRVGRSCLPYRLAAGTEGQSMLEFAFVLPILLLVMTGIIQFGLMLNQYQVLTNAVSAGARAFSLARGLKNTSGTAVDPCAYSYSTLTNAGSSLNWTRSGVTVTATYTPANGDSVSTYSLTSTSASCASLNMTSGDNVELQVSYPASASVFSWGNHTLTMSAKTTALVN